MTGVLKPIIYRATTQWFASVEAFRPELLEAIRQTKFTPAWGETRLFNMIRDRGDWNISRQRVWGVPIPVFYAEDGEPIIEEQTIQHVSELFREHGSNIWFEWDAKDLLPEGYTHKGSPTGRFTKELDIMDVWFDSGSTHQGVLAEREDLQFPADLYLEGSDQYRGWFNSSLITSVAMFGHAPYKGLLSHGFVLDGEGRKMSKSVGNVIVPSKVMNQLGADILRLWVASVDYTADVRVSDAILKQVSEVYRKIRNTLRFLHGNVHDFNPATDRVAVEDMREVDRYMYAKLQQMIDTVKTSYENYEFSTVYHTINNFVSTELSAFYLDLAKDVVYIYEADHPDRRAMQTVMYDALVALVKLLTPILPHTADELWGFMTHEQQESVQLTDMPEATEVADADVLVAKWEKVLDVRDDVLKALEMARAEKKIGKSLEAHVQLFVRDSVKDLFMDDSIDYAQLFIVSGFTLAGTMEEAPADAIALDHSAVVVTSAEGEKCERCWTISTTVGESADHPTLCARCAAVVSI